MPAIPTFETQGSQAIGGQGPPTADPGAFAVPGQALARGGQQVSDAADAFSAAYANAQRGDDAAQGSAVINKQLGDLQFAKSKIPNGQQAYSEYGQESEPIIQAGLAQYNDPQVRAMIEERVRPTQIARQELTRNAAFGLESSQRTADQDGRNAGYAQTLSTETDPTLLKQTMNQAIADADQVVKGGFQHPEQSSVRLSAMFRSAIEMKMESDPMGAQALQDVLKGGMSAGDMASTDMRLRQKIPQQQSDAIALRFATRDMTPQISADQTAGAQAVRDGLVARGIDNQTATAIAARSVLESGASPTPPNGDGSVSHGLLQWNGDRLANYQQQYGHAPEQGSLDEQLDFIMSELNGPEKGAAAAIAAAPTLDDKARAVSLAYVRPGLTPQVQQQEAANTVAVARRLTGQPVDTLSDKLRDARQAAVDAGLPPQWVLHTGAALMGYDNETRAAQATQQANLERGLHNLETNYMQGITKQPVPEEDIRSAFPGDHGEQIIHSLNITRQAGDLIASVQFATPDQENAARAMLATPGALSSNTMKVQDHQLAAPAGGVVTAATETADDLRLRQRLAGVYDQGLVNKHKALMDDPAAYAAAYPALAAKLQAVDPNQPETLTQALDASMALQHHLGLQDQNTRVTTNSQVVNNVRTLTTSDPATTDVGQMIDQMRTQYGDYWPRALGEMVQVGKLPAPFQIIASMTEPGQVAARQNLIRVMQQQAESGGAKRLSEMVPPEARKYIDQNIDDEDGIGPFRQTASVPGATSNLDLISNVREAARSLAYFNAVQGMPGADALKASIDGILNQKYDFSGTLRTPKGQMAAAEALTSQVQNAIKPEDLAPVPGNPDLTPDQRAGIVATAAKRNGIWIPSERDDGAVLMAPLRDGSKVPVTYADGSRVEVKWRDLNKGGPAAGMQGSAPEPWSSVGEFGDVQGGKVPAPSSGAGFTLPALSWPRNPLADWVGTRMKPVGTSTRPFPSTTAGPPKLQ
jgi:hypothetical protein